MWTRGPSTSTVETQISCVLRYLGDVDMRSFNRHSRDKGFPCLLGYKKQERPQRVDHYIYKHFTYNLKSTTDKQASISRKVLETFIANQARFSESVL